MRSVMCFRKANNAFQEKKLISTGKHVGGSIMVWACFSGSGPGQLALIEGILNFASNFLMLVKRSWVILFISCSGEKTEKLYF